MRSSLTVLSNSAIATRAPLYAAPHVIGLMSMHHIYDPTKKEMIENEAAARNLTGRFLYGKPGFVVVEGLPADVDRYERRIRSLRWQTCLSMGRIARIVPPPRLPQWRLDALNIDDEECAAAVDTAMAAKRGLWTLIPGYFYVRSSESLSGVGNVQVDPTTGLLCRVWDDFRGVPDESALRRTLIDGGLEQAWQLLNTRFSGRHPAPPPPPVA